jgi:hypothetical protein
MPGVQDIRMVRKTSPKNDKFLEIDYVPLT